MHCFSSHLMIKVWFGWETKVVKANGDDKYKEYFWSNVLQLKQLKLKDANTSCSKVIHFSYLHISLF